MKSPIGPAHRMHGWSIVACCLAAIALPAQSSGQATSSELAGVVVTESGDPIADVALSIGRSDLTAKSDAAGRFLFAAAPWGQVRLRA
ncbi:MAG TPA: carboxypeptidase-like regulatory domain-containing protein, partial [Gemmatimonadaceae bacterium]|nr:carboxypeptidase-like regulatory domain-containing protein [Gemmatimonadaceae bacterium]